jgi:hypothetical protein
MNEFHIFWLWLHPEQPVALTAQASPGLSEERRDWDTPFRVKVAELPMLLS